jgi:hypothetical protein
MKLGQVFGCKEKHDSRGMIFMLFYLFSIKLGVFKIHFSISPAPHLKETISKQKVYICFRSSIKIPRVD